MIITLTTPFDPGSHAPGVGPHPKAKIVNLSHDFVSKEITAVVCYGDDPGGDFSKGVGSKNLNETIKDDPKIPHTEYTDLQTAVTVDAETLGDAEERLVYAHLQAKYPELAGTVA